jgi:hypothetical protein
MARLLQFFDACIYISYLFLSFSFQKHCLGCLYKTVFVFFVFQEIDFQVSMEKEITWSRRQWGLLVGCLGAILLVFLLLADHSGYHENTPSRFFLIFCSPKHNINYKMSKFRSRKSVLL